MKHKDYITHIDNEEDVVYLKTKHFPVNMRLFNSSKEYKDIILQQCNYLKMLVLTEKEGYKKPHGMSSANAGLSFNIIAICEDRNEETEHAVCMINPEIYKKMGYNYIICTVKATNTAELTILSKHGFKELDEFLNTETGNKVKIFGKKLD